MTDFATLAIRLTSDGSGKVRSDLRGVQTQAGQTEKSVESLNKMMNNLKRLLAVGLGIQGIGSLLQMADTMKSLNAQVRFVTGSIEEYNAVNKQLFDIAQKTRASLEATTTLYTRSARALKDYGYSQQRILTFTETLNKAMAVGGVGAQEQASALFQLSQALGSGRLQGDEFRTIAESAPIILDVVAQYMGKTRAEVKELASEGKITSQLLFEAITGASKRISAQFEEIPLTFGQAMQQMQNATLKFVDDFSNSTGVFTTLAETISFLAQNFDYLALAIGAVALGNLAKYTQGMLVSAVATQKQAMANLRVAQTAQTKATAELAVARAEMQALSATLKLAQSEQTRSVIRNQMAAQSQRIIALTNAETVATQKLAASKQAVSISSRVLGGAMGLLGGPAGVITIAAGALFYFTEKAEQARAKALDLEGANRLLETSYKDMSLAALGAELSKHIKDLESQKNEVENLKAAISTKTGYLNDNGSGNPFFDARKTQAEIAELQRQLRAALEVQNIRGSGLERLLTELATKALSSGQSLAQFREEMTLAGVSSNSLDKALLPLNTDLLSITSELQRLFPNIDTTKISMEGLNVSVGGFAIVAPSAERGAISVASGISKMAMIAAIASGNLDVLKGKIAGISGVNQKLQDKIDRNSAMVEINKLRNNKQYKKANEKEASLRTRETLDSLNIKEGTADWDANYSKYYQSELALLGSQTGKNGGKNKGSKIDRFGDMYNDYTSQIAQLKAESASIAQYGGVSIYKEYDQLMEKLKTDRETFKNMTTAQIEQLKKLAQESDKANMAKQVSQYAFNKKDEFEQMQFEANLLNKTSEEQERLNYYRKIDQEIKQLSIGMSDEYVQKLLAEGEAAKKNYEEIQKLKKEKQKDPIAGLRDGFAKFGKDAEDVMGNVSSITLNTLNGMSDALTNFVLTGKMDFRSFAQSVIKDITSMIIKMMIFNAIKSAGKAMGFDMSFLGGASSGGYADGSWLFYRGGPVGFEQGGFTGLGGKYQPAGIVHRGEYVITKEATSRLGVDYLDYLNYQSRSKPRGFANGGGVGVPTVHQTNGQTNIKVNVINNGEAANAKVESKQTDNGLEITVELLKTMTDIAERAANNAITTNFRPGGAFA
ncbi:phage tail tape measure protein [Rodentibacter caecimuris]|uniref:phage tail tape measure protein n=1 Tax=Rodentibacter caecimuris TaxID=1796644 RepID=UPI00258BCC63|nr:phage tail tape measure protein [Rodentibacter heylii]